MAIIGRELERCGIDIAALSETRIHGETQLDEVGAGYTFFLIGHPTDGPTHAGVGFAIHSSLIHRTPNRPTAWSQLSDNVADLRTGKWSYGIPNQHICPHSCSA